MDGGLQNKFRYLDSVCNTLAQEICVLYPSKERLQDLIVKKMGMLDDLCAGYSDFIDLALKLESFSDEHDVDNQIIIYLAYIGIYEALNKKQISQEI